MFKINNQILTLNGSPITIEAVGKLIIDTPTGLEIRNKTNLNVITSNNIGKSVYDMKSDGQYLYFCNRTSTVIYKYNAFDLSFVASASTINAGNSMKGYAVEIIGNDIFVGGNISGTATVIQKYDNNLNYIGRLTPIESSTTYSMTQYNGYLYVRRDNQRKISKIDTGLNVIATTANVDASAGASWDIIADSNGIYAAINGRGIYKYNINTLAYESQINLNASGTTYAVCIAKGYLYAMTFVGSTTKLIVLDFNLNILNSLIIPSGNVGGSFNDIIYDGQDKLYVGFSIINIIDISNPLSPVYINSIAQQNNALVIA